MDCKHDQHSSGTPSFWRSRTGIGFIVIGAAAGYFLITEHLAHVVGFLPYLLLLACPLMHLFMHGGHGGHGHHSDTKNPDEKSEPKDKGDRL
jgi:hypothetical protein